MTDRLAVITGATSGIGSPPPLVGRIRISTTSPTLTHCHHQRIQHPVGARLNHQIHWVSGTL